MQEKVINELVNFSISEPFKKEKIKQIAEKNSKELPTVLPVGVHVPTEEELEEISTYMALYKKNNPMASKRQIRKAAQDKFNVRIFRKPYKKESHAIQPKA